MPAVRTTEGEGKRLCPYRETLHRELELCLSDKHLETTYGADGLSDSGGADRSIERGVEEAEGGIGGRQ